MKFKLTLNEKILFLIITSLMIIMYGAAFNEVAIKNNNNKMPFIADYKYSDNEYISFSWDNKPKYWYLSDIFDLGNIYSIGDFMMYQGVLIIPLLFIFYIYIKFKEAK